MAEVSAGILLYKRDPNLQLFLAHPGGPYWRNKDEGAWSIPKGLIDEEEDKLQAAVREFEEEVGYTPGGDFIKLGSITQKGGKLVHAWAVEGELPDGHEIDSNTFAMEWPPNTGNTQQFPEIDRAAFFDLDTARQKVNPAQVAFFVRLIHEIEQSD